MVEIASNDGYLLQHLKAAGVPSLGIEPAANVAAAAIAKGLATEVAFFGVETARRLRARGVAADLMVANNVFAHVPDMKDFVGGFATLLKPEGVATFEFPHVLNLINEVQFDTIYHEHFFYLSLFSAERAMATAGLRVFDVDEIPTHGGSLRLFVCHARASHIETPRVTRLRHRESAAQLDTLAGYAGMATSISQVKAAFLEFMRDAKKRGKTVAAYGAAAKGNTFLNFCGVHYPDLIAVYDANPAKQGKLTPGSHVPISPPSRISELQPDHVVILPWNLATEIAPTLREIETWGGQILTAVPAMRVI